MRHLRRNPRQPKNSAARRSNQALGERGFALVVTLTLMVLLSILALGMLSLSSVALRSSGNQQAKAVAQANARMAIMLAIGELQKSMGPDGRISAPSGILDSNPDTAEPDGLAHSHLTGVWNARDGATETLESYNLSTPNYSRDTPNFRRWLVSESNSAELEKLNFPQAGSLTNPVTLVNLTGGEVTAGKIPVKGGSLAWWVGDENCKARVNARNLLAREGNPSTADLLAAHSTPGADGMKALTGYGSFPSNSATSDKYISREQMEIAPLSGTNPSELFHDVTPYSESVLADVTKGTLRKDLSIYLERSDIDWLADWKNSTWAAGPLGPNGKIALSPLADYDVLAWKNLHHYYNMQRQVSYNAGRPTVNAVNNRIAFDKVSNPSWNNGVTSITPVVLRMQYLLSYGVEKSGNNYILYVYSYPVATLWNPYNVDMVVNGYNIFLHNLPIEHVIYRNGTKFTNHNWTWNQGGELVMRFGSPMGSPAAPITLKAGEQKIFNYFSTNGLFNGHNMTSDPQPWSTVHAGRKRAVAGGTIVNGEETDRIEMETLAGIFETSGKSYAGGNFQSSFEVRTESSGDHVGHDAGWRTQGFTSIYAWRFEANSPRSNQLSKSNFPSKTLKELTNAPTPFCLVEVQLKPLDEIQVPSKTWSNSIPSLPYMGATSSSTHGTDPITPFYSNPYSVSFDQKTSVVGLFQTIPYMGSSYTPSGQRFVADREVPQIPLSSLAQLQNLPLISMDVQHWGASHQQNHAIGNSYANPGVPANKIRTGGWPFFLTAYSNSESGAVDGTKTPDGAWTTDVPHIDRSYSANHLLWDEYFFSSMAPQTSGFYSRFGSTRSHDEVIDGFLKGTKALPNAAYVPYLAGLPVADVKKSLIDDSGKVTTDGHLKSAAHLMASGGFNINSTSVPAWTVLLASSHLKRPVVMDTAGSGSPIAQAEANYVVSRFAMPIGGSAGSGSSEESRWRGYRELTADEITQLAEAIVRQVKKRGPFRSIAEFINRRLASDSDDTALYGALQAALEDPKVDINKDYRSQQITEADISKTSYAFKKAALGSRFQGTPAYISQADILQPIAPIINARSDTFIIRGYGEALASDGKTVIATARCGAVFQRYPDYINTVDRAETAATSPSLHPTNQVFGRRFSMISFRWLTAVDI